MVEAEAQILSVSIPGYFLRKVRAGGPNFSVEELWWTQELE